MVEEDEDVDVDEEKEEEEVDIKVAEGDDEEDEVDINDDEEVDDTEEDEFFNGGEEGGEPGERGGERDGDGGDECMTTGCGFFPFPFSSLSPLSSSSSSSSRFRFSPLLEPLLLLLLFWLEGLAEKKDLMFDFCWGIVIKSFVGFIVKLFVLHSAVIMYLILI